MTKKIVLLSILLLYLSACDLHNKYSKYLSADPISIQRFDKDLFALILERDTTSASLLSEKYPLMLDLVGKSVIDANGIDSPESFHRLISFYSEPTLLQMYEDAIARFNDVAEIEKKLGVGFSYLLDHFPDLRMPTVYMHVSGFNQNVLIGDGVISLSIDKYLDVDYPLYQPFFPDYQRQRMQFSFVVQDYFMGWLMGEFPFKGKEDVLLERMIYEGKLRYLLTQAIPDITPAQLMGYTESECQWVKTHMSEIWKTIIERKHLYNPDYLTTIQYFEIRPSSFLSNEAPGCLGSYIGWMIVDKYMKETKSSLVELMNNNDAQLILAKARFKP